MKGRNTSPEGGCAGLWWQDGFGFFWIKEVLLVRSLMRSEAPPYRAGRIFWAWMLMAREVLGQQGRRVFEIFFCESSLSEGLFSGETWLGKSPALQDHRHSHSGHSFYSKNCGVPHNSGLPASSCATSCSSNRGNQSHPPTKRRSTS